jgi:hypothetical protein
MRRIGRSGSITVGSTSQRWARHVSFCSIASAVSRRSRFASCGKIRIHSETTSTMKVAMVGIFRFIG